MSTTARDLTAFIWQTRYRDTEAQSPEHTLEDTWLRVANAAAVLEADSSIWRDRFLGVMQDFRFLPGGRILTGAGTHRQVTLLNCFAMGRIGDSVAGVFDALKEAAVTLQQGGGVGCDFSTLRPRGSPARATGSIAAGPVSFLRVWDATCSTIYSSGCRGGAMMGTLRCDHPDIEAFIDAKREPGVLPHFTLSVLLTDAFMSAVATDAEWPLLFPVDEDGVGAHASEPRVFRTVKARELWQRLCAAARDTGEPGVLFIDRINAANNLAYCETIYTTNPCGEAPLPPYGGCNLGSINLTAFVRDAFRENARLDVAAIEETTRIAVRFLDNILDISRFPLRRQRERARSARRLGLGITGLADALVMLGQRYDSDAGRRTAAAAMHSIRDAAYAASAELASERSAFPDFEPRQFLSRPFILALPPELRAEIGHVGLRNSHLTAIAPAGTTSLLAGGISSGIEPSFGIEQVRRIATPGGGSEVLHLTSPWYATWRAAVGPTQPLPSGHVEAENIAPRDHVLMQAALQPFVDSGISKTIALATDATAAQVGDAFSLAYRLGLKGCAAYRGGARTPVLSRHDSDDEEPADAPLPRPAAACA